MAGGIRSSGGGRKPILPAGQKSKLTRIAPPAELMGEAAIRMWKTQSKILIERGVFELEDAPLLLAYCNAFHSPRRFWQRTGSIRRGRAGTRRAW